MLSAMKPSSCQIEVRKAYSLIRNAAPATSAQYSIALGEFRIRVVQGPSQARVRSKVALILESWRRGGLVGAGSFAQQRFRSRRLAPASIRAPHAASTAPAT